MPAAAVIPAPIAYIKVVAVKKLVVEFVCHTAGAPLAVATGMLWDVLSVNAALRGGSQDPITVLLTECRGGPIHLL